MTKDELLAAIAATITTNGVKGITAESLANILTEMVNASGGVGSIVIYQGETTLDDSGNVASCTQTDEQKAHNAEMFQILKTTSPMPMPSVDMSENLSLQMGSLVKASAFMPQCMYLNEESATAMGVEEECVTVIDPTAGVALMLTSDGTVTLMS